MRTEGISLIIIFKGRHHHLYNTLNGITNGTVMPDEIVLVEIGTEKSKLAKPKLPVNHILIDTYEEDNLPIAKARNVGADTSRYRTLVFLDVDCIPSDKYIESIKKLNDFTEGIYMGCPRYLTEKIDALNENMLNRKSKLHPHRPDQQKMTCWDDYGMFWSLAFFLTYSTFKKIGKFDEQYRGYGAEDTDFAFMAESLGVPFYLTPFVVYHQQHAFCRPPLNSLRSIVSNCNYFYKKWLLWPMINHLTDFADKKLIEWHPLQTTPIQVKHLPTKEAIAQSLVTDEAYA